MRVRQKGTAEREGKRERMCVCVCVCGIENAREKYVGSQNDEQVSSVMYTESSPVQYVRLLQSFFVMCT